MTPNHRKENMIAGLVGAFLGTLLGTACVVIIGQLGYVAVFGGMVMAVCALKGYELLGGRLSRKGAVISFILTMVMTYFAHQLGCAITIASAADVNVFDAFRSIGMLLEGGYLDAGAYRTNLGMLYFFTLIGAVPLLWGAFHAGKDIQEEVGPETAAELSQGEAAASAQTFAQQEGAAAADVYYPGDASWMRTYRYTLFLGILVAAVFVCCLALKASTEETSLPFLCATFSSVVMLFILLRIAWKKFVFRQEISWVFVQHAGELWRVSMNELNVIQQYRFTKKNPNMRALEWKRLPEEEQVAAKASIGRAIHALLNESAAQDDFRLRRAVLRLPNPQLKKETKWAWHISYQQDYRDVSFTKDGRGKLIIAKAYPDFVPAQGAMPATGPAPGDWQFFLLAIVATVAVMGAGYAVGSVMQEGTSPFGHSSAALQAKLPDETTVYTQKGVTFQVDSAFTQTQDGIFTDPETGTEYTISVQPGATREIAVDTLLKPIDEYRMSPEFDRFSLAYPGAEEDLVQMTTQAGDSLHHNILTVVFRGGEAICTGVALGEDENGTLVTIAAKSDGTADEKQVSETILTLFTYMTFTGADKQNYQSMYHVAREFGYDTVSIAFVRSPNAQLPFVRIPLPGSDPVEYRDDGYAVYAAAHGLSVYAAVYHAPEGPQSIVDQGYENLASRGLELYEDGIFETEYDPSTDVAVKQVAYWEGDHARIVFLVAQPMSDAGYYRYMEITYLPERMDSAYADLIEQFSAASDLTLPELEPF